MTYTSNELIFAFSLTLFAGLSTGIGSALAFFAKKTSTRFLTGSLGFSAGVMIYVSMIEIFVKGRDAIESSMGTFRGYLYATLAFFGGILLIAIIDKLVPSFENPHEIHDLSEMQDVDDVETKKRKNLHRMGIFSAIAIAIHNFPEGLATFVGGLQDPALGMSIAVAIAIHNIPEGIAVSVPLYYATGSRKKAFFYSFLSGLSEPIGAMLGYFFLQNIFMRMGSCSAD